MTTIQIITTYFIAPGGVRDEFNAPATQEQIALAEQELNITLPADYKDFLLHANGFEGSIWEFYARFDAVENIAELTEGYCKEFFPWAVCIGGNGGGEMFVIDKRTTPYQFGILPGIAAEEDFLPLGNTFEQFIKRLYDDTAFDKL